jgi:long-chain acyl-CoA synthetase
LVDVPEMGFTAQDKPHPRGEIYVRSPTMALGYHNDEHQTKESFKDGWFCTGDIGMLMPNRQLHIIDRKKNIFKLSQGEFVSPERLENLFIANSNYFDQMLVYGSSVHSDLIGIAVPNKSYCLKWLQENNVTVDEQIWTTNGKLKHFLLCQLYQVGKSCGLRNWEIPKNIYLESEPWTAENGRMTGTRKSHYSNIL